MKTPWHIWVVGLVTLVWHGGGAFDYLMVQTGNEAYLSQYTEPQRACVEAVPTWFHAAWAFGVWGSILGSLLILLRSRLAAGAFAASLIGMVASSIYAIFVATPSALEMNGTGGLIFSAVILLVILVLIFYARAMTRRGVLN